MHYFDNQKIFIVFILLINTQDSTQIADKTLTSLIITCSATYQHVETDTARGVCVLR